MLLLDHLAMAQRHVATGARLVAEQKARTEEIRRAGRDAAVYEALLAELEDTQRLHVEDMERLQRELAAWPNEPPATKLADKGDAHDERANEKRGVV